MKMNVDQLANELTEEFDGMSKKDAKRFILATFECIAENLEARHEINVPGYFKFKAQDKPERQARNPATGKQITVPPKTVAKVLIAKQLKDRINGDG